MRKLILAAAIALLSTSAFAGGSRGLSGPQTAPPQILELQQPVRRAEVTVLPAPADQPAVTSAPQSVEDKLKAAGELKPAVTPVSSAAPAAAPAPAQAAAPTKRTVHAHKPARHKVARRGETSERKARRIAARFGIYW